MEFVLEHPKEEIMPNELFFRLAFLGCYVFALVFRATRVHQPHAAGRELKEARRRDGLVSVGLRILFPFCVAAMWLYPFGFSWFQVFGFPLPLWARFAGIVLGLVGFMIFWNAHQALGKHFSTHLKLLPRHLLIQSGPYRRVRHPMYAVEILLCIAATLISANLLVGIVNLALAVLICARIPREERMLIERFGNAYRRYRHTTGKLFPRIIR